LAKYVIIRTAQPERGHLTPGAGGPNEYSMEIRHLKLIVSIADEGSITKAAEKLFLTQSALSHQLKELEDNVGLAVFYRVNRKLVPTPAGEQLIRNARAILQQVDHTLFELRQHNNGHLGTLRVVMECYSCFSWLPQVVKTFNERYPNIEIVAESDITEDHFEQLANGTIDLALVLTRKDERLFHYEPLVPDRMVVAVSRQNPISKKAALHFSDFENETLITHCNKNDVHRIFENVKTPPGFKPKKIIQISTTEGIIELVKGDLGIAVMSEWAIRSYVKDTSVKLLPFDEKDAGRPWYITRLKKRHELEHLTFFSDLVRSAFTTSAD
jgi:LysR family transcriptional regulator, regulator for metE and metH